MAERLYSLCKHDDKYKPFWSKLRTKVLHCWRATASEAQQSATSYIPRRGKYQWHDIKCADSTCTLMQYIPQQFQCYSPGGYWLKLKTWNWNKHSEPCAYLVGCTVLDITYGEHVMILNHWGRVTHICVSRLTTIGSDNGLSPGRHQAVIWTDAALLLTRPLEINFSEILIKIRIFSFKKIRFKMSSGKWCLFCLGLNELIKKFGAKVTGIYIFGSLI